MDRAITAILFTIAGIISAVFVFNAVYPAASRGSSAIVSIAGRIEERIESHIKIIHAAGELDGDGVWQDSNGDGDFDVFIWIKNIGVNRLVAVEESDLFFGQTGDFSRIPYVDHAAAMPYWEYTIENASEWLPGATIKITLHFSSALSSGMYLVKFVSPNGVVAESYFSM